MDNLTPKQRSYCMSRIRSAHTNPELCVRRIAHRIGYRFRLHRQDLPGCPDLVFPKYKKVVFVHGCFWHRHGCNRGRVEPATNPEYWKLKRQGNVDRHRRNVKLLKRLGWEVHVVWECEAAKLDRLEEKLADFLAKKR